MSARGERIALLGANGVSNIAAAQDSDRAGEADTGEVRFGSGVEVGYDQQQGGPEPR